MEEMRRAAAQADEPPPCPVPEPVLLRRAEPNRLALPALREDERVAHASEAGVVVIIRRRRAA